MQSQAGKNWKCPTFSKSKTDIMKDIIITSKIIKREIYVWVCALIAAQLMNVYAIVKYNTQWRELYSQLGYILMLSIVLYLLIAMIRLLVHSIRKSRLFRR
jgi:hypothetical protein